MVPLPSRPGRPIRDTVVPVDVLPVLVHPVGRQVVPRVRRESPDVHTPVPDVQVDLPVKPVTRPLTVEAVLRR